MEPFVSIISIVEHAHILQFPTLVTIKTVVLSSVPTATEHKWNDSEYSLLDLFFTMWHEFDALPDS